jgi:hypothetical protein
MHSYDAPNGETKCTIGLLEPYGMIEVAGIGLYSILDVYLKFVGSITGDLIWQPRIWS